MEVLVRVSGKPNRVIGKRAASCAVGIVQQCPSGRHAEWWDATYSTSNRLIRCTLAECLFVAVTEAFSERTLRDKLPRIAFHLQWCLSDACVEVRDFGKRSFPVIFRKFPDEAQKIVEKLAPQMQRLLNGSENALLRLNTTTAPQKKRSQTIPGSALADPLPPSIIGEHLGMLRGSATPHAAPSPTPSKTFLEVVRSSGHLPIPVASTDSPSVPRKKPAPLSTVDYPPLVSAGIAEALRISLQREFDATSIGAAAVHPDWQKRCVAAERLESVIKTQADPIKRVKVARLIFTLLEDLHFRVVAAALASLQQLVLAADLSAVLTIEEIYPRILAIQTNIAFKLKASLMESCRLAVQFFFVRHSSDLSPIVGILYHRDVVNSRVGSGKMRNCLLRSLLQHVSTNPLAPDARSSLLVRLDRILPGVEVETRDVLRELFAKLRAQDSALFEKTTLNFANRHLLLELLPEHAPGDRDSNPFDGFDQTEKAVQDLRNFSPFKSAASAPATS